MCISNGSWAGSDGAQTSTNDKSLAGAMGHSLRKRHDSAKRRGRPERPPQAGSLPHNLWLGIGQRPLVIIGIGASMSDGLKAARQILAAAEFAAERHAMQR